MNVEISDRLLAAATFLACMDDEDDYTPEFLKRVAKLKGVREDPLLALFGYLPLAKIDPRKHQNRCIGRVKNTVVNVYAMQSSEAALDVGDNELLTAWSLRRALFPAGPVAHIALWDSRTALFEGGCNPNWPLRVLGWRLEYCTDHGPTSDKRFLNFAPDLPHVLEYVLMLRSEGGWPEEYEPIAEDKHGNVWLLNEGNWE